jgi:uncharacterized protein with ParB-like and HNH nuclease domain
MDDLLKNVRTVFSEAINNGKQFVVPSYQRGYKWNRENVFKLLDDLKNFEKSNWDKLNSFYCIQNITIVPLEDKTGWNVVDGQQRLTTIFILLSYLRKFNPDANLEFFSKPDCLKYNVREETGKYLKEEVFTGGVWDSEIKPDTAKLKDQWYILDVAKGIKDWFDTEGNSLQTKTITDRLKLIVNNMENPTVSEEEIFAGLNGGKVELDGADLVRAVLITRSAKEKYYGSPAEKVKEFRMRIALELDEMNLWWAQKEQKTYFEQFLPDNKLKISNFKHASYPIGLLYKLYFLLYSTTEESFGIEFFENGRNFNSKSDDDHWELYETLIHLHHTLQMWFIDPLLYHWIGYLIFRFKEQTYEISVDDNGGEKKEKGTVNFKMIWTQWEASKTKNAFITKIISIIQALLTKGERVLLEDIKDVKKQWYGIDPTGITNVLVLMDVIIVSGLYREMWTEEEVLKAKVPQSIADMNPSKTRLPSEYFTKSKENFEHIRSCAPNETEGKEVRSKGEWISFINMVYDGNIEASESQLKDALMEILGNYPNDELDDTTIKKLNQKMNEFGQHSIGNMALLDEHVNKSYGNDPYQKKIQRIFSEFMKNEWYIRPYTMTVFEYKIKDTDRVWRWTQQNIKNNACNIANNIETVLNLKQ